MANRPTTARKNRSPEVDAGARTRRSRRNRTILWSVGIVAVVGLVAFFPAALLTDRPIFCTTCHSMVPFYDAWKVGAHNDVWCIDCHVERGMPARFAHKFVALQEVYAQFLGRATFPTYNAVVPDARCLRCHPDVPNQTVTPTSRFSHQTHLNKGLPCQKCHAATGHKVTFDALARAGVLNQLNAPAGLTYVGQEFRTATGTSSTLTGHKKVPCSDCHDQANLECSFCHTTPANHYGADCKACHRPNVPFATFAHPPSGEHGYKSRPCVKCHPNGYQTVYCTCHKGRPPQGD